MRTLALVLLASPLLVACGKDGDACKRLCEAEADCSGLEGDDRETFVSSCYDVYEVTLLIPTTRPLQLSTCNASLDDVSCE